MSCYAHPARQRDCNECAEFHKVYRNKIVDCVNVESCKFTFIDERNKQVMKIIDKYHMFLYDGNNLIPDGIRFVIEQEEIKDIDNFIQKIQIFFNASKRKIEKKNNLASSLRGIPLSKKPKRKK